MDSKTFNSLSEAYAAIYSKTVDETYTVTSADKKGNTPAYQAYKAGKKKKDGSPMYKAADHMKEGVRDVDPEKGTAERKAKLEKKRGMKLDDHPQYKKEEVENVEELYKGKHGQSEKEYQDGRSDAGKQISGDSKHSGAAYSHRSFKGQGKPAKPGERQKAQGRMTQADRDELAIRKAALKKEEVEQVDEVMKHQQERDRIEKMKKSRYYSPPTKGVHGEIERRKKQKAPTKLRSGSLPEETGVEEGIDFKGAKRIDDARKAAREKVYKKSPSTKQKDLMKGKFRPGASDEERKSGYRDIMREKGTQPKKDGKPMFNKEELDRIEAIVNSWED